MRNLVLIVTCMVVSQLTEAQLKTSSICPPISVDLIAGSVNNMHPESPWAEIYKVFPCFTEAIEEPSATGCAGVFLRDKGINFYTYRDYIEITSNFGGKMTPAIMGTDRNSLFKSFGLPQTKDFVWDAYQTRYGTMVVFADKDGKINRIIISTKSTATMRLCD
ncbi:MAG: hypothetical protein ABI402_01935 [Ferruginibacter sp.]